MLDMLGPGGRTGPKLQGLMFSTSQFHLLYRALPFEWCDEIKNDSCMQTTQFFWEQQKRMSDNKEENCGQRRRSTLVRALRR